MTGLSRAFIAFILLLFAVSVFGQSADTDYKKYLKNGTGTNKNAIKIDLLTVLVTDIKLHYERKINRSFSVDLGVIVRPYLFKPEFYQPNYPLSLVNAVSATSINPGYMIEPRYYFFKGAINYRSYVGVRFMTRTFDYKVDPYYDNNRNLTGKLTQYDYSLVLGYQIQKKRHWLWDISIAGFITHVKTPGLPDDVIKKSESSSSFSYYRPSMKLGYIF
jgi:hypothetical protein